MSQARGFDMTKVSTASKILLIAGVLYIIDLFLPWQRACVETGIVELCDSRSGASGIGVLNLLLAIALVAWEGMAVGGVEVNAPKALISAALAGAIVVFTILKVIVDNDSLYLFAWIGIILALVIGYGGWMRWQEHEAAGGGGFGGGVTPPPPPSDTGPPI